MWTKLQTEEENTASSKLKDISKQFVHSFTHFFTHSFRNSSYMPSAGQMRLNSCLHRTYS